MTELVASDRFWNERERDLLARVSRLVIGPDPAGVMPAVDDERILNHMLTQALEFERPIRRGLAQLDALWPGSRFFELDDAALGESFDAHPALGSFLRAMMQVVAQCYYQDERVLRSLGFEARPPYPDGHQLEEGDWDLLEPVRKRQPFYR